MGFYSFYKIIKDIIRTLFGNKVLRVVIIVGLIVLCLSLKTTVFGAYDTTIDCSDTFGYDLQYDSSLFGDLNYVITIRKYSTNISIGVNISNYDFLHFTPTIINNKTYGRSSIPIGYKKYSTHTSIFNYNNISSTTASSKLDTIIKNAISSYNNSSAITNNTANPYLEITPDELNASPLYIRSSDIVYLGDDELYNPNPIKYPEVATSLQDLETLNFDVISVNAWDYSNEDIDVLFYDLNYGTDTTDGLYPKTVITLNKDTTYFQADLSADSNKNAIYWIPNTETGLTFFKGGKYGIKIAKRNYGIPRWRGLSWR